MAVLSSTLLNYPLILPSGSENKLVVCTTDKVLEHGVCSSIRVFSIEVSQLILLPRCDVWSCMPTVTISPSGYGFPKT